MLTHASVERARIRAWSRAEGACTDDANERSRLILIRQKDRRRAIGFLRRRAVCDTDDDEKRDDDAMGTFFDARTRIAHFRSKRTHERTAQPMTPPRLINTECLACRASLLAFTRVVRETSKKIHARASRAKTTTLEEGEDKRISQSTRRERLKGTEYRV